MSATASRLIYNNVSLSQRISHNNSRASFSMVYRNGGNSAIIKGLHRFTVSKDSLMAIKKIELNDTTKEKATDKIILSFDQDSNGRLHLRGSPPRGITADMVETIGSGVYIGISSGKVGQFTWSV
jgi:hypothetical protein